MTNHPEIVLILKTLIAAFAIVFVVSLSPHVIICRRLSVELGIACFAGYLRLPMSAGSHMLVCCSLRIELPVTHLALVARAPVALGIHVLIASALGTKGARTCLAFWPVIIVGHMRLAIIRIPESRRASLALIHFSALND